MGNLYEVITTNDDNSFYVGVLVHNCVGTDAIVAKFWAKEAEVVGGFRHFVDPTNFPKLSKLRIIEGADNKCNVYKDGGTECTHLPGSFSTDPNFAPVDRLDEIITHWDDATEDFRQ